MVTKIIIVTLLLCTVFGVGTGTAKAQTVTEFGGDYVSAGDFIVTPACMYQRMYRLAARMIMVRFFPALGHGTGIVGPVTDFY